MPAGNDWTWLARLGAAIVVLAIPAAAPARDFERDVQPILLAHCVKCHGETDPRAGLDLRTLEAIRKGGDSGPAMVAGDADRSLLFEKVSTGEMPPGKSKLNAAQIRNLRDWLDAASLPDGSTALENERQHWAFRKPGPPPIPAVLHAKRIRSPVDAFLLARLEPRGLNFAADADRITLIRRASLDLLGYPPAPEEADAFVADGEPDAYERLLDRLLASPHFGERWGRHWLDVVGYTDTVGFDQDSSNIIQSEGKWRYRDYVIQALNEDMPYDRFVTEQLAGDELVDWRKAPTFTPEIRRLLTATGYLRTARDQTHEDVGNLPANYFGVLHDTVAIVGNSLLGLTLNCAQCHSHKFDPVSQRDYYRLMAIFTPAYNPNDWRPVFPYDKKVRDRSLPDVSPAELAAIERHNQDVDRQVASMNERRSAIRGPHETRLREAKLALLPEPIRADTLAAVKTAASMRNDVQKYLASKFEAALQLKPEEVAAVLSPAERSEDEGFAARIAAAERTRQSAGKIQALFDLGPPPPTHLLKRGNHDTPGEEVPPGFLSVLSEPSDQSLFAPMESSSGRRLALARWLTRPNSRASSLLSRVMANRMWQRLFGRGLVPSPENFGRSGEPPTHPELLEWLAADFAGSGWRLKRTIKLLMSSTAYRQSSRAGRADANMAADPDNTLLGRMRLRRLEAEAIRDSLLSVGGRLDPTMGGPPVLVQARSDGLVEVNDKSLPEPDVRRSVYLLCRRSYNLSLLTVFDQPLMAQNCPSRDASAVPLQSLAMLNNGFVAAQAFRLAERVRQANVSGRDQIIQAAFRRALVRTPDSTEAATCARLLERQTAAFQNAGRSADEAEQLALQHLCLTLLNTSEFLYVD